VVTVEFMGPIDRKPLSMDVSSLKELAEILGGDEEMKRWLAKCAVAVNDTMVNDPDMILKAGDRVTILPPVCGG